MGCIQTGSKTIISVNPILHPADKRINSTAQSSPKNKKRSTLKEISRLAYNSKDIRIKNLITLIGSKY